ncbi:MAG: molybdopterin molybdotransferase MoeA [Clostridiales bacterium]
MMTAKPATPHKKLRITLEDAYQKLFALPQNLREEILPITALYGRILAEDLYAPAPVPHFARAPLDGYAFIAADIAAATPDTPVQLRVIGETSAGDAPARPLMPGEAVRIMTGGPFPPNADAMVRYEDTEFTAAWVRLFAAIPAGSNLVPAGDDIRRDQMIGHRGQKVSAPICGLLASCGYTQAKAYAKPVVTILNTGNELVEPGLPLGPGKIHNSSFYTLTGYLTAAGAEVVNGGIVGDAIAPIAAAIDQALTDADMVITTGGVSVGDYDFIRAAIAAMGGEELFWKIRIRPGGTLVAASKQQKLILGLSGNPGSAALGLQLLGLPFLRRLTGADALFPQQIKAILSCDYPKPSPFGRLIRGRLLPTDGKICFLPSATQGYGAVSSLLDSDMIAVIPIDSPPLTAGTIVDAYWLNRLTPTLGSETEAK